MTTVQSCAMESAAFASTSRFDSTVSELLLHLFTSLMFGRQDCSGQERDAYVVIIQLLSTS